MIRRSSLSLVALAIAVGFAACATEETPSPLDRDTGTQDGVDDPSDARDDGGYDGDALPDDDGGDTIDGGDVDDPEPTTKSCGTLPSPPPGELCQVSQGSSDWLLLRGDVLTEDVVYDNGSVLVDRTADNAKIACTGCDCSGQSGGETPTVVSCAEGVISPGLINPHDHLGWATAGPYNVDETRYNHRHEWRTGARQKASIPTPSSRFERKPILYGELRHLFGGATSIAGSTRGETPKGLLRNLDTPEATGGIDVRVDYSTFPLRDTDGTLRDDGCDYNGEASNALDPYSVLRNDIYLPHVAEGIDPAAQNEFECLSKPGDESRDLIEDNTSIIHGIGLTANDIRELAANGAQLVWSPRTNISLYGQTADVRTYRRFDVPIALGTDWPVSGSMNMLRELSCAARLNDEYFDGAFHVRDLWQMATHNGARALGVGDRLGRLAEGYIADIALFDGRDKESYRAVVDADASGVHLVMRGGEPLYGDESVVAGIAEGTSGCTRVNVCGTRRQVCVERDTSEHGGAVGFDALQNTATSDSYPLFTCDTSDVFEPTCVPSRPNAYDGEQTSSDADGDGIPDGSDSCPAVFNPKRPLGSGQPNADDDSKGDTCDRCPTTSGEMCTLDDWDGDGVADDEDNCPFTENRAQADGDMDGVGDACDRTTTIYDIRNGAHSNGERVSLDEVVVTAVHADSDGPGIWVQVPEGANRYQGAEKSGIFVYLGAPPVPERGDLVDLRGRVADFHGRQQITGVVDLTVVQSGTPVPAPVVAAPCEIRTGGSRAGALRGVLVRVEDVEVTDPNPDAPDNDYGEFAVGSCGSDGGLRIDNLLHAISPDPTEGDNFAALTGPLHYSFNNTKMEPRDASDVEFGPARLTGIQPATAYLKAGTTGIPAPGFELVLDRASSQPLQVNLTYPDSSKLTGPSTVTIPAGTKRMPVSLEGKSASSSLTDFAQVEASIGSGPVTTAKVLVYDDALPRTVESLTSAASIVQTNSSFQVTARLNIPASSGGETLSLSSSSDLNLPSSSPQVTADGLETTFSVGSGSNEAKKTLTASLDSSSASVSVTVKAGPVGECLIISEYIEGSGSNNKAIELYNCGGSALDLSNFGVCVAFNSQTSCSQHTALQATTLNPGEVYGVCHSKTGSTGDPVAGIKNNCDEEAGNVINFNGNDRVLIFEDDNGDGDYDASGDAYVDSLGELDVEPSGEPWKDKTLRRCDMNPYLGQSSFDYTNYYTDHPKNDASHYGTPPSSTSCP